jgi:uncharacterized protein
LWGESRWLAGEKENMTNSALSIRLKNLSSEQVGALLPDGLILLGYRGSIAHNMYTPQSNPDSIDDKDIMGVFVGPIEHYLGFGKPDVKERFIDEWDAVSYEARKYISLLLKCNPNVLSLLWLNERHLIYKHELGDYLRANKDCFVTKAAYHSFNGYAYGQFKRMTHFNQEAQAEMAEIEGILTENQIDLNELNATQEQLDSCEGLKDAIARYKGLKGRYYSGGYMGAKRKELVRRFGYDCKNAAHLIRLLRMGIEFLIEGELHVSRDDSEQLLSIKRGEWTLDKVKEEAERLFALAQEAYVSSPLPPKPDTARAEKLCMEIVSNYHRLR